MNTKKGFTLVEVLVVMAILMAIVAVVGISVSEPINKASITRALAEAEQLATGAILYYQTTETWAPDTTAAGEDALFYTPQYISISASGPSSYLGSNYNWDWQSWEFSNSAGFSCWQSIDLYRGVSPSFTLVIRECVRSQCVTQKYCNQANNCWNTASARDAGITSGPDYIGNYITANVSAICENCTNETECANKFQL